MRPVLRFHWPLFRRAGHILLGAGVRYTTGAAVVSLALTVLNPELGSTTTGLLGGTWVAFSRWWALVPLGLLFLLFVYGLMQANFEEFQKIERDKERLKEEKAELEAKLEAAEGRNAPEIVVDKEYKAPNGMPVVGNMSGESGIVPVLFSSNRFTAPAASIEVDGPEDTHVVAMRYEVRGGGRYQFQPEKTIRTATHLQVLDESGKVVMYPTIYNGMADVAEDDSWGYTVSRSYALSGLAKGAYDLRVLDYASGRGGRNYYDTKLLVTKLGKPGASPVTEN